MNGTKSGKSIGERGRSALACAGARMRAVGWKKAAAAAGFAFLLGGAELPFGTAPLGVALVCAASDSALPAALGLAATGWLRTTIPQWLGTATAAFILVIRFLGRAFVDPPLDRTGFRSLFGRCFRESLYLRLTASCVAVFAVSLYRVVGGGFLYYDLFGALFSVAVAPIATFLYAFLGDETFVGASAGTNRFLGTAARVFLATTLAYATRDFSFFGIDLGLAAAFIATLAVTARNGLWAGLIAGGLSGLCGGTWHALILLGCAIAAYCLYDLSPLLAASVAAVIGTLIGALDGEDGFSGALLPLILGAAAVSAATRARVPGTAEPPPPAAFEKTAENTLYRRAFSDLSGAFSELGEVFAAVGKRMREPTAVDLYRKATDLVAVNCDGCDRCGQEKHDRVAAALSGNDAGAPDDCPRYAAVTEAIREAIETLGKNATLAERDDMLAEEFGVFARMFGELRADTRTAARSDDNARSAAKDALRAAGYSADDVFVAGRENADIAVEGLSPIPAGKTEEEKVRTLLSGALGYELSDLSVTPHGKSARLTASRACAFGLTLGSAFSSREGMSGDTARFFRDRERHILYALLGDGMGSGGEAAMASGLGVTVLQKLLLAGVRPRTALEAANSCLRFTQSGECTTTVDLMRFEETTGHATFFKSGAAPTCISRGETVYRLVCPTLPVGILRDADAGEIGFDCEDGDLIVMVSDGVCDGECPWLENMLPGEGLATPGDLAAAIRDEAKTRGGNGGTGADDISVFVIACEKCK